MEPSSSSSSLSSSPSSEKGKLFVGGISSETREEALMEHFKKYGEVKEVVVMRDRNTGNGRGFAFVQFLDPQAAERALEEKEKEKHVIRGRTVEVKRAIPRSEQNQNHQSSQNIYPDQSPHQNRVPSRDNTNSYNDNGSHSTLKKIFVGGLPDNIRESEFRNYFAKFGTITDVVVMYDPSTQRPRGFGFITFDSEEAVRAVTENNFHELNGKMVEVKRAVPKDGNNHSNNNNHNDGSYNSRMSGAIGPSFAVYQGVYPPYGHRYGFGPFGYMSAPIPSYPYTGYGIGSYGGLNYGSVFPGPRGPWSGHGMMARRSMMPYGNLTTYSSYVNGGGYKNVSSGGHRGVSSFSDGKGNQTGQDVQSAAVTGAITTQMEAVKLDA
ncbi:heterogeneous nuclear ribonucleoprotein 1-like isoform X1 [Typha latifolia]|uniref:heterogeneous nuclear ribonucleoprotein 1-like isoform X1 n=1 Tax=Typha latifolia TaxID=4733 RepID=UPI003C305B17